MVTVRSNYRLCGYGVWIAARILTSSCGYLSPVNRPGISAGPFLLEGSRRSLRLPMWVCIGATLRICVEISQVIH